LALRGRPADARDRRPFVPRKRVIDRGAMSTRWNGCAGGAMA